MLAISPDKPAKVKELEAKAKGKYKLLSDAEMKAARALGLAFKVDDDSFKRLKGFGIDLEDASGKTHRLLPVPAVYILDAEGEILFEYINPQYTVRIAPEVVLAAARALK